MSSASPATDRGRTRLEGLDLALVGLVASVLLPLAVLRLYPSPARTITVFAYALVGAGCAVMCHVRVADRVVSWALAVVLSLAADGLLAAAMIWAADWHPKAFLFLAGPSGLSCLARLAHLAGTSWRRRRQGALVAEWSASHATDSGHARPAGWDAGRGARQSGRSQR